MNSVYIKTFGCQMNVVDSKRMLQVLIKEGFIPAEGPEDADVIIVNTCSVREKPEKKVTSELGRLRFYKDKNNGLLGMAGCVSVSSGKRIFERLSYLDFVIGPESIQQLPDIIERARRGERVIELDSGTNDSFIAFDPSLIRPSVTSFVTVMKGCDNFCSYCIVPYTRGREKSRPVDSIINEIKRLANSGVKEVTLVGQNVNSYRYIDEVRKKTIRFSDLLKMVAEIDGIERIRFVTSHPKDFTDDIIDVVASDPKFARYIHLPIQSGSDRILELMNRRYTVSHYLDRIDTLRGKISDIAISSDFIVGFPGETIEDFEQTLAVVKRVEYDSAYSFAYSERPGTKAVMLPDPVPKDERLRRLSVLQGLLREKILNKNKMMVGKRVRVLVEGRSKRGNTLFGRTSCNRVVNFEGGTELVGKFVEIEIIEGFQNSLSGRLVG